jgi:hypothetical protein
LFRTLLIMSSPCAPDPTILGLSSDARARTRTAIRSACATLAIASVASTTGCAEWLKPGVILGDAPYEAPVLARLAPTVAPPATPSGRAVGTMEAPLPALEGGTLTAHNVELLLPTGCVPLRADAFIAVAAKVNDDDSELLAACSVPVGATGRAPLTLTLLRHRVKLETSESTASMLRKRAGVLLSTTTTLTTTTPGLTPEGVATLWSPTRSSSRPAVSVLFGALDGLYVLYAEVDADVSDMSAWTDLLTSALRPTASAHAVRWRAPVGLAPSATAIDGAHKMRMPDGMKTVSRAVSDVIGADVDPLDFASASAITKWQDESGVAAAGMSFRSKLLRPFATTPAQLARMTAEARGCSDLQEHKVDAKLGAIARVDGVRSDGSHVVFATFQDGTEDVVVIELMFDDKHWPAYAPFIDASLATLERGSIGEGIY